MEGQFAMMTDVEFQELIERLHKFSANDGDIGHAYWTRVIRQLREMRAMAFALNTMRDGGSLPES
jgi:hypothetical protein